MRTISAGMRRFTARGLLAAASMLHLGCGGSGDSSPTPPPPPPPPPPVVTTISVISGDQQTARRGSEVAIAPRVVVRDQRNAPMSGVTVTFTVSVGGGTLAGAQTTTDGSGAATLGGWTLGAVAGANRLTATATGGEAPSVAISASARNPRWTVMVYLAADNNLTMAGVRDIDEMEAAGAGPEVQTIVQGEFSPDELAYVPCAGCRAPSTFRYLIPDTHDVRLGPDQDVQVLGGLDMTDPATLRDFVAWAKQVYPAERYALVLWNHGGGYTGLIADDTHAGSRMMSLADLRVALTPTGGLDLVDFDMCLMGGMETLEVLNGLAKTVIFSEETEPGDGDFYTPMLRGLQDDPTADTRTVAARWIEAYNTFYQTQGARSSTTKSGYDLAAYTAFDQALAAVATTLTANITATRTVVGAASQRSQKFTYPQLTDLVDWIDSLRVRVTDTTLLSQLADLRMEATDPSFRLLSRARNGAGPEAAPVARATGLHILLPSGTFADALPDVGVSSFAAYQTLFGGRPWTKFLAAYLAGAPVLSYSDLAPNRYEMYLVWDTAAVSRNADIDFWVLEPDGNLYIPYLGVVTPNGTLTGDSHETQTYFEGYTLNRFVQSGRYKFYAFLYVDPTNFSPIFDIQYRTQPTAALTSLFAPNYPRLSLQTSVQNDPTPTFPEIEGGVYSDLRYAAYWDITPSASMVAALTAVTDGIAPPPSAAAAGIAEARITAEQLAAVRDALRTGRVRRPRRDAGATGETPQRLRIVPPRDLR